MPKQVIINMKERYPFGQCAQGDDQTVKVLVRRELPWGNQPENLLERAQFFRRLNQILEEDEGVHLLYEYVPIRMLTWISNINQKFIESFCRQLIELGQYLAKCHIDVPLSLENVGMDQNYRPKYFLDLDFQLNQTLDKTVLKNNYHHQILNLFNPYVQNKIIPKPIRHREPIDFKSQLSPSKALSLRQPKSDNYSTTSNMRLKQKAVALQKERKNESISVVSANWDMYPAEKNRKQSILSSVSNVKINRLGRRMEEIKSRLRNMYSPDNTNIRFEHRSIEKNPNSIAFSWNSTQKIYANALGPDQEAIRPKMFCQSIMRDLQQEETIFQKFEQNLAKQLTKALPMKKNETLKAKEYQQMKKSDDGYFKDFFQVLEDKPKGNLAIEAPRPAGIEYEVSSTKRQVHQRILALPHAQPQERVKIDKSELSELQNRVKTAINKSKKLINKFKAER